MCSCRKKEHFRKPPLRVTNDGSVPRRFYSSALDSGRSGTGNMRHGPRLALRLAADGDHEYRDWGTASDTQRTRWRLLALNDEARCPLECRQLGGEADIQRISLKRSE